MAPEVQDFGRLYDFVRSAMIERTTTYFETSGVRDYIGELPIIEKYEITSQDEEGKFASSAHIQRYFENILEKLPLIAVTTVGGRKVQTNLSRMVLTDRIIGEVISNDSEPYSLVDADTLIFTLEGIEYTIQFEDAMFNDISNFDIEEFGGVIGQIFPRLFVWKEGTNFGIESIQGLPLIITGGTGLTGLGLTVGQGTPEARKTGQALAGLTEVVFDVVTSDRNQRIELSDILSTLFGFYVMEEDVGQWLYDKGYIIFQGDFTRRGESEISLDNAPFDKLYFDSVGFNVFAETQLIRETEVEDLNFFPEQVIP